MADNHPRYSQACPFCGQEFYCYELILEHIEARHTDGSEFVVREEAHPTVPATPPAPGQRQSTLSQTFHDNDPPPLPQRPPPSPLSPAPARDKNDDPRRRGDCTPENYGSGNADAFYVSCPLEECGEQILQSEITEHIELHQAEQLVLDDGLTRELDQSAFSSSLYSNPAADTNHSALISFYAPGGTYLPTMTSASSAVSGDWSSRSPTTPHFTSTPPSSVSSGSPKRVQTSEASEITAITTTGSQSATPSASEFSTDIADALRNRRSETNRTPRKSRSPDSTWSGIRRKFLEFGDFLVAPPSSGKLAKRKSGPPKAIAARLGKAELGPYAYEERMPRWLYDQLDRGPKITRVKHIGKNGKLVIHEVIENETPGIVPMLARLSELDPQVGYAYYCHPAVSHICKTRKEGGFCGFRNIQMQVSYLRGAKAEGYDKFPPRTPGILELQDLIEDAWDHGISEVSRAQIGKLKGTRKWIGTLEAHALYTHLGIDCEVYQISDSPDERKYAYQNLMEKVELYFAASLQNADDYSGLVAPMDRINRTLMPPIYLQQPGHSLTIVGFERYIDGSCSLIVLDPMYLTSRAMHQLLDAGPRVIRKPRADVMEIYRRGGHRLHKHLDFEILMFRASPPMFPAWDVR